MKVDAQHTIEQAARRYAEVIRERYPVHRCLLYDLSNMGCEDDAGESAVLFVLLNGKQPDFRKETLESSKIGAHILKETGIRIVANPVWQDEWQATVDLLDIALRVRPGDPGVAV